MMMKKQGEICSSSSSIPQRRIEFHPARKPHASFTNRNADFHLETLNPNSGSSSSQKKPTSPFVGNSISSSLKQSDDGDLLELGLDAELFNRITFRRIGAGLENLGNTCFLNSVLQCLTYTEPFAAYLQSGKHKSSCHIAGFCAMCAIQNHVSRVLQSTGRILAPKDLVMNLRCISRNFRNARQEDAHEYMVNLLESMHKCSLPSGVPTESASAYEKSLVHKIFGGRLRSQVKCTQCSHCSNTFDPFLDLSLEISKADSLLKALTHFTAVEQLDGGERQYNCQCCKQKVRALKQLTVHKAPYVLSIHLKRFGSHIPGQKINKKVEFRPTLDLKPYVSGSYEGDLKYTLYGVLVHAGWSTHSGHYYCFVRTSAGMWYSLDDNRVVQVSEKTVLEQKAYMLFYFRDRKNLIPKKPTNIARKENIMPSSLGDGGRFVASSNKKAVQNGPSMIESGCSSAITVKDAVSSDPLDEHRLKEASFQKTKDLNMAGSSADSVGNTLKEQVKWPSSSILHLVDNQRVAEDLIQPVPLSCKASGSTSHPTVTNAGENVDRGSGDQRSHDLSGVTVAPVDLIGSQNSDLVNKVAQENQGDEKDQNNKPCQLTIENGLGFKGSALVEVPNQFSVMNRNVQKKELDHHIHRKDLKHKNKITKAKENDKGSEGIGLAEVSNQSSVMNGSVQKKDLDRHNHKAVLKPKKKVMKRHCMSLHLHSKLSLKTSLGLCKKKKHKKIKKSSSKLRSIQVNSDLDSANGLKISVSEKMVKVDSTHSPKQHKKSDRKKDSDKAAVDVEISGGDSMVNKVSGDLKERVCLNTAVLATGEPQRKCSSMILEAIQCDTREPDSSLDTKRKMSDLKGMLTRGIEDVTVPRWDGIESRPSQVLGFKSSQSISIGYVPDEWDEEYDRGKRKKVRGPKDSFGGPNPFQEIATMKEQSKKPKRMDKRNSSGNQPFRI